MPPLNVPAMIKPILQNYDEHVNNFIRFLRDRLQCRLVYQGPEHVRAHILAKTVYACSVKWRKRMMKDVFPVMIGSRLDLAIRHQATKSFDAPLDAPSSSPPFQDVDIGRGYFIIHGSLRHLPYFYTNDPTNTHVVAQKGLVRVYAYNAQDRGKELTYYVEGERCGETVVVHNDGHETLDDPNFFAHCPHPVDLTAYMRWLHRRRRDAFDIDHLGNKMVVSPGHLFTKLFVKYLYGPLSTDNWALAKSRVTLVRSSIASGYLLHVLSRKTLYFKEGPSAGKMTAASASHREIGAHGEIFIEKSTGCYRDMPTQTYPLNPFLLYLVVRQISSKVNHTTLPPHHPSYDGWFCKLGVFDTKNVGRVNTMVRGTAVTTSDALDPVYSGQGAAAAIWDALRLEPLAGSRYCVVVNEACVPVTRRCFDAVDLLSLKRAFGPLEAYERDTFIVIRYKTGLLVKPLPGTDLLVTPYDEVYWSRRCFQTNTTDDECYSYWVDLNPLFRHNAYLKNILALNALKNAVLATTPRYAHYFLDSVSAYRLAPGPDDRALMEPVVDGISSHFVLLLPQVMVTYMSFQGLTQEDCIVKRADYRGFDCCRFYTLRVTVKSGGGGGWVKFHPVQGDGADSSLLGTVMGGTALHVEPNSIHVRATCVSPHEVRLTFSKTPFRVVQHALVGDTLSVSVEQSHACSTGDKLCSLHGQKGVIRVSETVPTLDGTVSPVLIVNPYCMFRMTTGQPLEAMLLGGGRDARVVHNSDGRVMVGVKALYGKTLYMVVAYFSKEHVYAPDKWVQDKVTGQSLKGRSRNGGMKNGSMEMIAMRGLGIAFCFELKFFEHGDRVVAAAADPTETVPQSECLVNHEFKVYKFELVHVSSPAIAMEEEVDTKVEKD